MNFALMFALALGIDYALFVLMRFRSAFFGERLTAIEAVAVAMDTAGKAVLFSGITVLISLSAVMLVPSPAFRSMSLGIMLSVVFVLAATLTLLPAVLAKLGPRVDKVSLPWAHSESIAHRALRAGASACGGARSRGSRGARDPGRARPPVLRLDTGMPSIKVVPPGDQSRQGYDQVQAAFGDGAPGALQVVGPPAQANRALASVRRDPGVASVILAQRSGDGLVLVQAIPAQDPSSEAVGGTVDRLRGQLPEEFLVGVRQLRTMTSNRPWPRRRRS